MVILSQRDTYNRRVQQSREQELKEKSYSSYVSSHFGTIAQASSDDRTDFLRRTRKQQQIEQEKQLLCTIQEAERKRIYHEKLKQQEELLALEFAREKRREEADALNRLKIRQESEELRELEAKLKQAAIVQEIADQIELRKLSVEEQRRQEEQEAEILKQKALEQREREREEELRLRIAEIEHKSHLASQIAHKHEHFRADELKQIEEENKMVQEIMERIYREDAVSRQIEERKQVEMQHFLQQHSAQVKERRALELQREMEEEQRRQDYLRSVEEAEARRLAQKKQEAAMYDELVAKLAEDATRRQKEREDYLDAVQLLREEEAAAAARQEELELLEKTIQRRREMRETLEEARLAKLRREELERQEEERITRLMVQRFKEEEARERRSQEQRRIAELKHFEEMALLQRKKAELVEQERLRLLEEQNKARLREEEKRRIIAEERQSLIAKHAHILARASLPKGTFKNEQEKEFALSLVSDHLRGTFA
ncbi:hypothetical protein RCL1_001029 [Eukaryota sp. TZLM3-RCL]